MKCGCPIRRALDGPATSNVSSRDSIVVNKVLGIFACRHKHTSLPFPAMMATAAPATLDENPEQPVTSNHYVVCLECGKRLSYDWSKMRLVKGS